MTTNNNKEKDKKPEQTLAPKKGEPVSQKPDDEMAGQILATEGEAAPANERDAKEKVETQTIKIQLEIVSNASELSEDKEKTTKVGIDDEKHIQGGKIETKHIASCVGYALYMPGSKDAYVGHFNSIPDTLAWEEDEDRKDLFGLKYNNGLKIFIFGGDDGPIANQLIKKIFRKFEYLWPEKQKPVFCEVSGQAYRDLLGLGATILPKASGISIDTDTNLVRLLIKDTKLSEEEKTFLRESYSAGE